MNLVIGVDVGGTFTDVVSVDRTRGLATVAKVLSNLDDQSTSVMAGLRELGVDLGVVDVLVHGTTVGTNTLIERTGAQVGLITTRGFRDVLELRRRDRPHIYGLTGGFQPLIPRRLRFEVDERTDASGKTLIDVDPDEVVDAGQRLLETGCEVVVVSFLHAYANPSNEQAAVGALRQVWPNEWIVAAGELLPEYREFERVSTAVVNGYLLPPVAEYLDRLSQRLQEQGYRRDLLVVQSNGGVMSRAVASRTPAATILSGPAAGTVAAAWITAHAGAHKAISFDMGGTSLDVCLIVDGRPLVRDETRMDFGIPIRFAVADIHAVGAGGGSIAHVDEAGLLRVGPRSAGASPGPACYGLGGQEPTLTDANLVLGRLGPKVVIGQHQDLELDALLATKAIANVAEALGMSIERAAEAIVQVADHQSAGAVRLVSVQRGHDPRDFAVVAFGGSGGLHAASLLGELGISQVVVPPYPGITSALGCVLCDLRHDFVQTVGKPLDELDSVLAEEVYAVHIEEGLELIANEGEVEGMHVICQADMAYQGQTHLVRATLPGPHPVADEFKQAFVDAYRARFQYFLEEVPIMVMTLRTSVIGIRPSLDTQLVAPGRPGDAGEGRPHPVFLGGRWIEGRLFDRHALTPGTVVLGPAVIRQRDATTFVPPDLMATTDERGNLRLEAR